MGLEHRRYSGALLKILRLKEFGEEVLDLELEEKYELLRTFITAFTDHRAHQPWKAKERWRSKRPDEAARAFFERVYMSLPYEERPYTHQLANRETGDRTLYEAMSMILTNNRRHNRTGPAGSIDAARSLSELLPMMGSDRGDKQEPLPPGFKEALSVMAQRVASLRSNKKSAASARQAPTPATKKRA